MEDSHMDDKLENKAPACIPFFVHENMTMHYNAVNRRMLVIIITICLAFVTAIGIFVYGNTVREKEILNTMTQLVNAPEISTEVTDGAPT